jgi:AcrR family transcriptional regulator
MATKISAQAAPKELPLREKILNVARDLFYQQGIRAVGVDTIVEKADVAKTSLYRFFSTKDELIASFLRVENDEFWMYWDKISMRHAGNPREEMSAHLKWIAAYISSPRFRGCPFLNAAAEFPDKEHPARRVCYENKRELHGRLEKLAAACGIDDPTALANYLVLLIDGAFANSPILGKAGSSIPLIEAAEALIDAAPRAKKSRKKSA